MSISTVHGELVQLYERAKLLPPGQGLGLLNQFDFDLTGLSASVKLQVNCYLSGLAWMGSPPVPPPSIAELLEGESAPLPMTNYPHAYAMYYEAMRVYLQALQNYNSYRLWIRAFVFGPQPLISADNCQLVALPCDVSDYALVAVRDTLNDYLDTLSNEILRVWDASPPRPPPTVVSILF